MDPRRIRKMSIKAIPISVQQIIDSLNDRTNSRNSRENYARTLDSIKLAAEKALEDYRKEIFKRK